MKAYCGKCKKECGLFVSRGPIEYDTSEFWGMTQTVPIGRDIAILSDCHMYIAYQDEECMQEFDAYTLDPEELNYYD